MSTVQIRDIYADELDSYLADRNEDEYQLVDVREPSEYQSGHIPGALLVPLGSLEKELDRLDSNREIIFYCASGRRSRVASMLAAESGMNPSSISNVVGGFLAWDGRELRGFPRIRTLEHLKSVNEILKTAADMEKGAWRFYSEVVKRHGDSPFAAVAERLVRLERNHALSLHKLLQQRGFKETFESFFETLEGGILEGGITLDEAVERLEQMPMDSCLALSDMALEIEYSAYDLYRVVTFQGEDRDGIDTFEQLAKEEKKHIRVIVSALVRCVED